MTILSGVITGNNSYKLAASSLQVINRFVAWGYSGFTNGTPVNNSGVVYLGFNPDQLPIQVSTGSFASWELPEKQNENFNNLWVKSTVGNGIFIMGY